MPLVLPPRARRNTAPPALQSSSRFRVRYRHGLDAITGQVATFTRASTSTIVDSNGATVTVGYGIPRREVRSWSGTACGGVRFGSGDDCWYSCDFLPERATILLEGINIATAQASGGGLWGIMRDDATGNRLVVRGTGSTFAVDLIGGSTSTATLGAAVGNGVEFAMAVQIDDDNTNQRVRIGGIVGGSPVAWSAWGSTITRITAWGTGAKIRANRVGSAGTQGDVFLRQVAWNAGLLELLDMQERT